MLENNDYKYIIVLFVLTYILRLTHWQDILGNCYHDATRDMDPLKSNPDWFTGYPKACGYLGAREGETGSGRERIFVSAHGA